MDTKRSLTAVLLFLGQLLLVVVLFAVPVSAQSTTGIILGSVMDASGGVLPGATVTVTHVDTGSVRTAITEANGTYQVPALPPGVYRVEVALDGFKSLRHDGLRLQVDQNLRVDERLELGTISEQVTVTAGALHVDTQSSSVGNVVDSERLSTLPTSGRDIMSLALLSPGMGAATFPATVPNQRSGPTLSAGGAANNQNNVMLDGASLRTAGFNVAQPLPSPDSIQEFQVLTSTYTAEYGDASGATLMAITKSGTNRFTGNAWEYFRNTNLTGTNFFAPSKPVLEQNQFGGSAGGPIVSNRTFFFVNYEALRLRQEQINRYFVPTAAELTGDFSASATPVRDPTTGQPFTGNKIPANRLDPMALNIAREFLPIPTTPDGLINDLVDRPVDGNQVTVKVDHRFGDTDTTNVRFYRNKTTALIGVGNVNEIAADQSNTVQGTTVSNTHVFGGGGLVGEGRVSYTTITTLGAISPANLPPQALGALWTQNGTAPLTPQVTVAGRFQMSSNNQDWFEQGKETQFNYKLSWSNARHSVIVGGAGNFRVSTLSTPFQTAGLSTFNGSITGNVMADFLIGRLATFSQSSHFDDQQTQKAGAVFVQDSVKFGPRVTINLGLRYEFGQAWEERDGRSSLFREGQQSTVFTNAPLGTVAVGDAGIPPSIYEPSKTQFAPRVGGAWDVRGNGRTSLRAAYGIYYAPIASTKIEQLNENPPFTQNYTPTAPANQWYNLYAGVTNPFPFTFDPNSPTQRFSVPMQLFTFNPDFRMGYLDQFNVNLQQQLGRDLIVQIGYFGSRGHHLPMQSEINAAVFGPGATLANAQSRRPFDPTSYASIADNVFDGKSAYDSMQFTATKRYADGYTLQVSYTLSKNMDNRTGNGANGSSGWPDPKNGATEYSLSNLNQTHALRINGVWEFPWLLDQGGIVGGVLGGWRLAGIITKLSGQPINITSGVDAALLGSSRVLGAQRPNMVGDPVISGDRTREEKIAAYFNTAAFAAAAPGTFGDTPRNVMNGPGSFTVDASLIKQFEPWGSDNPKNLQFRLEVFNLLNTVNLGAPVTARNAGNFGQITTANDPRIVQLALRFGF